MAQGASSIVHVRFAGCARRWPDLVQQLGDPLTPLGAR